MGEGKDIVKDLLKELEEKNPAEKEYLQAVEEVLESLRPVLKKDDSYVETLRLFLEPERIIIFRVPWVDKDGKLHVNRGFRVQYSSALGPYKGGVRFDPSVTLSVVKFLAFEQSLKNALTGLALGGGKGGADFDPKNRSDLEIMRFCQSFMNELHKYIGPETDVPAGDMNVSTREIGYMFGQYKKINGVFNGVVTGKGVSFGGSELRPEATGYGLVYFVEQCLRYKGKPTNKGKNYQDGDSDDDHDDDDSAQDKDDNQQEEDEPLKDKKCLVSGAGNVAQYCVEKLIEKGAKVLTMSDSKGYILCKDGISSEELKEIKKLKSKGKKLKDFAQDNKEGIEYNDGEKPWNTSEKADIALPCATQNELDEDDAKKIADLGVSIVGEGANMPCSKGAIKVFRENKIMYAPGKASNAGGVATSGLEMAQNSMRLSWSPQKVDRELKKIMEDIYRKCANAAKKYGCEQDIQTGANIAGFLRLAEAVKAQGYV